MMRATQYFWENEQKMATIHHQPGFHVTFPLLSYHRQWMPGVRDLIPRHCSRGIEERSDQCSAQTSVM